MTINVLILCAGRGTRLEPLTNALPKTLLPLDRSETILLRLLRQFRSVLPSSKVWVNISTHSQVFLEYLCNVEKSYRPRVVLEPELLGAANTIFEISKFVDGPLLVVHGDLVLSNDYVSALAKSVLNFPRFSVVCHFRSADNARSKVLTDNSGLILTLQNSKNVVNYGSEILVNSGIYYFPTLEDLGGRPELSSEITDSILQSLINRKKLYSINLEFERISVDSLLQLHQARELVIKEKSSQ